MIGILMENLSTKLALAAYFSLVVGSSVAKAQVVITGSEYTESIIGQSIATVDVRPELLFPGLYVIFGAGGNIVASVASQGVLIVDDQFAASVPKIQMAVQRLGGSKIDYIINTHWHYDHADGNALLARSGSWIVSHENSRELLAVDKRIDLLTGIVVQSAYPSEALPVITFKNEMKFNFNGQRIDVKHFGPAHTAGDTAVFFRDNNVVHTGDVYHSRRFPFIDTAHGGNLDGMIKFCEAVLMESDRDSVFVPGHGPVTGHADFLEYVRMLKVVRDRVARIIENGGTFDEVLKATPTEEWNSTRGDPTLFLTGVFTSLEVQ